MNKLVENCWDFIYKHPQEYDYYDLFSPHADIKRVAEIFQRFNVSKILDVGCGLGGNLLFLSQRGFDVLGIDYSLEAIIKLQDRLRQNNLSVPLFVGTYQNLPFSDKSFDAIICVQTLQHGYKQDVQQGIAEISRVLREQGLLFLTAPGRIAHGKLRYSLIKTADRVDERVYIPTQGKEIDVPHYIFNKKIIRQLLRDRDFAIFSNWRDKNDYYCILAKKK